MELKLPTKNYSGFTLIEILVVIAIMAILATFIFPRISNYINYYNLKSTADNYVSLMRAAQGEALSGDRCGSQYNPQLHAYNWHFGALDQYGTGQYYYHTECIDLNTIKPEYNFTYPRDISILAIYAYKTSAINTPIR